MGVYIKGKRKPGTCYDCDFVDGSDDCFFGLGYTGDMCDCVYEDCPLIEIKTPHGRLIDADAFSDMWSGNHIGDEDENRYHDAQWIYRDEVDKVSTVIECEVE